MIKTIETKGMIIERIVNKIKDMKENQVLTDKFLFDDLTLKNINIKYDFSKYLKKFKKQDLKNIELNLDKDLYRVKLNTKNYPNKLSDIEKTMWSDFNLNGFIIVEKSNKTNFYLYNNLLVHNTLII